MNTAGNIVAIHNVNFSIILVLISIICLIKRNEARKKIESLSRADGILLL